MKKSPKEYAAQALDLLKEVDKGTNAAYYKMGQILQSIYDGELYLLLGYPSISAMVEEELSYGYGTASRYMSLYSHSKRLHWSQEKTLKLIEKYSYTHMTTLMPGLKQQASMKDIAASVKKRKQSLRQINFALTAPQYKKVRELLLAFGAVDNGTYLIHTSEALLEVVDEFDVTKVA